MSTTSSQGRSMPRSATHWRKAAASGRAASLAYSLDMGECCHEDGKRHKGVANQGSAKGRENGMVFCRESEKGAKSRKLVGRKAGQAREACSRPVRDLFSHWEPHLFGFERGRERRTLRLRCRQGSPAIRRTVWQATGRSRALWLEDLLSACSSPVPLPRVFGCSRFDRVKQGTKVLHFVLCPGAGETGGVMGPNAEFFEGEDESRYSMVSFPATNCGVGSGWSATKRKARPLAKWCRRREELRDCIGAHLGPFAAD